MLIRRIVWKAQLGLCALSQAGAHREVRQGRHHGDRPRVGTLRPGHRSARAAASGLTEPNPWASRREAPAIHLKLCFRARQRARSPSLTTTQSSWAIRIGCDIPADDSSVSANARVEIALMSTPRISVVIPTYNRGYIVGEAIQSVLRQTAPADEIIVVDDGSTDNTSEILERFGDKLIVIRQSNKGVGAARNTAIEFATADWVAFLDSDDLWLPERVSILRRDISGTDAGVHVANLEMIGRDYSYNYFDVCGYNFPKHKAERHESGFSIWMKEPYTSALAVRRDWISKMGGFDTSMRIREDYDFMARLMTVGPWLVTSAVICQARRFQTREPSLSSLTRTEPVYTKSMEIELFERVLSHAGLSGSQLQLVRRRLSGARFDLAYALAGVCRASEARVNLLRSAREHPALKGWLRAVPPLLLGKIGYRIVFVGRRTRSWGPRAAARHALQFR
jgi:glycosyltransferase involved in cell wall biosynthesis